ncbi:undecaprenyl-diphosphate phosphatase, partial [Bacillus cereus]|nr:undecaprenyl-diphosphate phosphatase [Bacillus cereus]
CVAVVHGQAESLSSTSLIVGTLSAAFLGSIAVSWMIQYLKRHSLIVFAYYVWGLGILILMLQFTDVF